MCCFCSAAVQRRAIGRGAAPSEGQPGDRCDAGAAWRGAPTAPYSPITSAAAAAASHASSGGDINSHHGQQHWRRRKARTAGQARTAGGQLPRIHEQKMGEAAPLPARTRRGRKSAHPLPQHRPGPGTLASGGGADGETGHRTTSTPDI